MGSTVPNFHRRVTQCQKEIFALNFDAIVHWRKLSAIETSQTAAGCIVNDSPFLSDECIWVYGLYLHGIPSVPECYNFVPAWYTFCTCMIYLVADIPCWFKPRLKCTWTFWLHLVAPGCTPYQSMVSYHWSPYLMWIFSMTAVSIVYVSPSLHAAPQLTGLSSPHCATHMAT